MALLTIPSGSTFSNNRNNIVAMLEELETRESITLVHMDKEERFRGVNRDRLETALAAILTADTKTSDIETFGPGSSFMNCRPAIRRMFIAAYV